MEEVKTEVVDIKKEEEAPSSVEAANNATTESDVQVKEETNNVTSDEKPKVDAEPKVEPKDEPNNETSGDSSDVKTTELDDKIIRQVEVNNFELVP